MTIYHTFSKSLAVEATEIKKVFLSTMKLTKIMVREGLVKQSTDHFVGDGYFFLVDADRVLVDDI
jgi:hypothetical protein